MQCVHGLPLWTSEKTVIRAGSAAGIGAEGIGAEGIGAEGIGAEGRLRVFLWVAINNNFYTALYATVFKI